MVATQTSLTADQRHILYLLFKGVTLKKYARNGEVIDTVYQDTYSPAIVRWLFEQGYIELRATLSRDEVYEISLLGIAIVKELLREARK